ncbi:alpha-ketoglutarate-dependent dioxygenase AlkB family protein [Actinomadura hibisca]|uniref:alpha-ketoglutarate-dependent dioxygenase AlkB family protein n=1 Tax=Actinomadura hibisca TaxID=68565 RepID=UPI00082D1DF4|nr:alpha-ketoglutarate-dependent dioxygenase AlkB [Actinomadura hibisca]
MTALIPRPPARPAPGVVLLPGWLDADEQRHLVRACRQWARPPAGMRRTRLPGGGTMSVRTVCLGRHWEPYRYVRHVDGEPVKPLPAWLADLGRRAVADTGLADTERPYAPDLALVNFYDAAATMGLHQDRDERSPAPVVSLSLGDTAVFRLGNTRGRSRPWTDMELESGDLLVFGGPARLAYHGITRILPGTGPADIDLAAGRLNITLRESGFSSSEDGFLSGGEGVVKTPHTLTK